MGQEGVEAKTGNRKIERDIKGSETHVRGCGDKSVSSVSFFLKLNAEALAHFPNPPVVSANKNKITAVLCFQAEKNSLTFIISWHLSSVIAV